MKSYTIELTERELHDLKTILVGFGGMCIPSKATDEQKKILESAYCIAAKIDDVG